jgi:serine/threonine-protein kinase RsbW
MADIPNVCLNLSNRPENVLVVRQALTGLAENRGLDPIETNDLNTAVTEASNNVVQHAYEGEEGPLEVEVYARTGAVLVVVRDHGVGIRPHSPEGEDAHAGIGLPVIHALTQSVEFRNLPGGGTEVRMQFAAANAGALEPVSDRHDGEMPAGMDGRAIESTVEMTLAPSAVAQAVLPRVLSALAARAHFSTDRISDLQLLADALAANAGESISGSRLGVAVTLAPRDLELLIGPLRTGSASRLVESSSADGVGGVIERLADDHHVSTSNSSEMLALRLVEHR